MALPIKRAAVAPQVSDGVNFLDLGMYVAGGGLPEGDYALFFTVQMYQAQSQTGVTKGPPRLGVMVAAHSLTDPEHQGDKAFSQFYSMGSNADKSFAPNPETGKSIVPIPGGPGGSTLNVSTNWAFFLKSLYDCGLPQGIASNDLSVLDGVWAHISNVPEPIERQGFQSKTGEAEEVRKNGTIAIVTEIKDDGKPWEGGGGMPTAPAKGKAPVRVAPKAAAKAAPAPVQEVAASDDDVQTAAINGMSAVLEKAPAGCPRLALKTGTFKAVQSAVSEDMAQAVIETYFADDAATNIILGQLGYNLAGGSVKPL